MTLERRAPRRPILRIGWTEVALAVGLVAVIRKILFVLSSEASVSAAELGLLIAMIAVFVVALILVSRYEQPEKPADSGT